VGNDALTFSILAAAVVLNGGHDKQIIVVIIALCAFWHCGVRHLLEQ
jgi:hypothetical protein